MEFTRKRLGASHGGGVAVLAGLLVFGASAAHAGGAIVIQDPALASRATLTVSIPSVAPDGTLPANYTADGRDISPPVSWSAGPPGTQSYVVVLQDLDSPGATPALHWLLYNVLAGVTSLPRAMRNEAEPSKPAGAAQGENFHRTMGYSGPRPPVGDAPHHYDLQVFALDRVLKLHPGATLPAVERAMAGHVLASGELIATYAAPDPHAAKRKGVAPPS